MSLPMLALMFATGAGLVWYAGTKLARYADEISERTGLGQAVVGVLLLGAVTSLPEISTVTVATVSGNPNMAVNNLLGGIAFQVLVIALADAFARKQALTSMVPDPRTILNALVSVVLLTLATLGVMLGDWSMPGGVGFFPVLIAVTYVICVRQLSREVAVSGWVPAEEADVEVGEGKTFDVSSSRLALLTMGAAMLILAGGTIATLSAEAIAESTGTGTGLIGLTLLAFATSLPELSTAIAAVRMRRAELAIGDILGGNMFDVVLILLIDLLDDGEPILRQVDAASMSAALLGIMMTALVLIGLIERGNRQVLRLGYDSIAVIIVYIAGIAAIFTSLPAG